MAFCRQCGFENPEGAKFCGSCGADLSLQEMEHEETFENDSAENQLMDKAPMTNTPVESEPPAEPTPPEPTMMTEPVTPPPVPKPTAAPSPAPTATPLPTEKPKAPAPQTDGKAKNGGGKGKTCLGIGCAIALVLLLAIGGLGWWGYSYIQKNGLKVEDVLNGEGGTASTAQNNENGTSGEISEQEGEDEEILDEKEIAEGTEENEGMETTEGVEGKDEKAKDEAKAKKEKRAATANKEKAKQLATELGVPAVSYNVLPKHDMFYLDKDSEIGVQCKISQQSGRATMGTVEVTHWFTGEKFKYNLQSCGNSIYLLANPKSGGGSTYLFVYEGGKRMLYGEKGKMKEVTMK